MPAVGFHRASQPFEPPLPIGIVSDNWLPLVATGHHKEYVGRYDNWGYGKITVSLDGDVFAIRRRQTRRRP